MTCGVDLAIQQKHKGMMVTVDILKHWHKAWVETVHSLTAPTVDSSVLGNKGIGNKSSNIQMYIASGHASE